MKKIFNPVLILFLLLSGCGYYSLKGTLPPHIKTIAIPVFLNRTAEINLQEDVTDKISQRLIAENILTLAGEKEADSILKGTIIKVSEQPATYTESQEGEFVEEYRITIVLSVEWYDRIQNKTLIKRQFSGFSEYDPTGASGKSRDDAINEALDDIAEDIINSITNSGW